MPIRPAIAGDAPRIEKAISSYVAIHQRRHVLIGSLLCGSYVTGNYGPDSDIDVLMLVKGAPFDMRLVMHEGILFDRMIADPATLGNVLSQASFLSDVLSLSFGAAQRILMESQEIDDLLSLCAKNIRHRKLEYVKDPHKMKKNVDGIPYTLRLIDGVYRLAKGDKVFS